MYANTGCTISLILGFTQTYVCLLAWDLHVKLHVEFSASNTGEGARKMIWQENQAHGKNVKLNVSMTVKAWEYKRRSRGMNDQSKFFH